MNFTPSIYYASEWSYDIISKKNGTSVIGGEVKSVLDGISYTSSVESEMDTFALKNMFSVS